jgi:hypothetical protein
VKGFCAAVGWLLLAGLGVECMAVDDPLLVWQETTDPKPTLTIGAASTPPSLEAAWDGPEWESAHVAELGHWFDQGTYRPQVRVRALYDRRGLYLHYLVDDRFVLSTRTEFQADVWRDACVEFFVQPKPDRGYFNFEINAGGTLLLGYKEHPSFDDSRNRAAASGGEHTVQPSGMPREGRVPWELARAVQIAHSLPNVVAPERAEPVQWRVAIHIPFELLEAYVGPLGDVAGQSWRANFYKCSEDNSHPHWGTWSPVLGELNFHQPRYFGHLQFED